MPPYRPRITEASLNIVCVARRCSKILIHHLAGVEEDQQRLFRPSPPWPAGGRTATCLTSAAVWPHRRCPRRVAAALSSSSPSPLRPAKGRKIAPSPQEEQQMRLLKEHVAENLSSFSFLRSSSERTSCSHSVPRSSTGAAQLQSRHHPHTPAASPQQSNPSPLPRHPGRPRGYNTIQAR